MLELFTTDSVTVHNEWAKITATFWNKAAVGAFGAGVVLPLFSDKPKILSNRSIFVLGVLLAFVFHCIARAFLSTLH